MSRGEPACEYDSEQKAQYREMVWATFADVVFDSATARVLFFPGRHGFEIPVALKYGFQEANLIACEENAAILATAKWRKEYPSVRCYGTNLNRTIDRLVGDKVRLNAVNLDYCSNLCGAVLADLRKLVEREIWDGDQFAVAVTLLKGREDTALVDIAKLVFGNANGAADRIGIIKAFVTSQLYMDCDLLHQGEYRSGTKNMAFGVLRMNALNRVLQMTFPQFHCSKEPEYKELLKLLQQASTIDPLQMWDDASWNKADDLLDDIKGEESTLRDDIVRRFNLRKSNGNRHSGFRGLPILPSLLASECYELHQALLDANHEACTRECKAEQARWRQRYIKSETEKAEILQAGRAYR